MEKMGKTRAFLIEFIIVILFFSVSAVITLQLFLAANEKSTQSSEKTTAYMKMQTMAEELKENSIYLESYFSTANGWQDFTRYYDKDFSICEKENAFYILQAEVSETEQAGGEIETTTLIFYKMGIEQKQELCRLEVKSYLPDWEV